MWGNTGYKNKPCQRQEEADIVTIICAKKQVMWENTDYKNKPCQRQEEAYRVTIICAKKQVHATEQPATQLMSITKYQNSHQLLNTFQYQFLLYSEWNRNEEYLVPPLWKFTCLSYFSSPTFRRGGKGLSAGEELGRGNLVQGIVLKEHKRRLGFLS